MKYVIALLLLVLSASIFAGTPPVPPPPYDSLSLKAKGVALTNIAGGGASAGQTMKWNGSNWVPSDTSSVNLRNVTVSGDITVAGHVRELNRSVHFDTSFVRCLRNPNYLHFKAPDSVVKLWASDTTGSIHYDSISAVHASAVYFPGGFLGYKVWAAFTTENYFGEQPYIRVSNDDSNFIKFPGMPDSLDPISWPNQGIDSLSEVSEYCSDVDLFPGSDGKLWVVYRQSWGTTAAYNALYVRSTSNGISWSAPKRITGYTTEQRISPAIWLDTSGTYKMWTVETMPNDHANSPLGIERLLLWEATYPDSIEGSTGGWHIVDTVRQYGKPGGAGAVRRNLFPSGSIVIASDTTLSRIKQDSLCFLDDSIPGGSNFQPRHVEVVDNGSDEKIVILMGWNMRASGANEFKLFLGTTSDGKTIRLRSQPILGGSGVSASYDSLYPYRSSGWVEDQGSNSTLRLLYTAKGRTGTSKGGWKAAITDVDFLPYVDSMQIPVGGIPTSRITGSLTSQTKIDNITIDTTTTGTTGQVRVKAASLTTSHLSASAGILGSQLSASAAIAGSQLSSSAAIVGTQLSATAAIKRGQLNSTSIDSSWFPKSKFDNSTIDTTSGGLLEVKALGITASQIAATTITGAKVAAATLDSSKIANSGVALEDINWSASNDEYWEATQIFGRDTILAGDSVALSFPRYTGQALLKTRWMFSDSTYDVSTAEKDTVVATVTVPYPFILDSVAYKYIVAGSAKVDSIRILNSNPKALSADTSIAADATDRTSISAARVVTAASKSVAYGGCQFIIEFCITFTANSKGHVRIGDIQFIGHRRQ